jgi:hypothetical protein
VSTTSNHLTLVMMGLNGLNVIIIAVLKLEYAGTIF